MMSIDNQSVRRHRTLYLISNNTIHNHVKSIYTKNFSCEIVKFNIAHTWGAERWGIEMNAELMKKVLNAIAKHKTVKPIASL